jgi:hypothetical protein
MNRNIPVQVAYDRTNKGVDIRNPSSANFLIDSQDRVNYNASTVYIPNSPAIALTSADFTITKPGQNLITGFFTRFAATEITLDWNIQNVSALAGNNTTQLAVNNGSGGYTTYTITIPSGNYTVAEALAALVTAMNTATSGLTTGLFALEASTVNFGKQRIYTTPVLTSYTFNFYRATPTPPSSSGPTTLNLAQALGFLVYDVNPGIVLTTFNYNIAANPLLLAYNYIDITSPQLASQQKVKDATTSNFDAIDVIYRWCFANDESYPVAYDSLGYKILPGYKPFSIKRTIPFPKQIRWDSLIPVGNLQFQLYTDKQSLLQYRYLSEDVEFKILMLVSEV